MMFSKQRTKFVEESKVLKKATLLNLPYNEGSLSMVIIMPPKGTDLNDLQDSLANRANPFKYAMKELFKEQESDVEIYLPKFKIESEFSLIQYDMLFVL